MDKKNILKIIKTDFIDKPWNILGAVIILIIAVKTIFYASISDLAVSPDQRYHQIMALLYKKEPWKIFLWSFDDMNYYCNNYFTNGFASITTQPHLYANLTGKLLFLIDLFVKNEAVSMKAVTILQTTLGFLTIFYIYKISQCIFKNKLVQIISVLLATNIQMFSYLINFLSYDNLVNLTASASIYYFLKFINRREMKYFFFLLCFLAIGSLTKFTFGVLLVLILAALAVIERKQMGQIVSGMGKFMKNRRNILLTVTTVILVLLTIIFYNHNILVHHVVINTPEQVLKEENYCRALFNPSTDQIGNLPSSGDRVTIP